MKTRVWHEGHSLYNHLIKHPVFYVADKPPKTWVIPRSGVLATPCTITMPMLTSMEWRGDVVESLLSTFALWTRDLSRSVVFMYLFIFLGQIILKLIFCFCWVIDVIAVFILIPIIFVLYSYFILLSERLLFSSEACLLFCCLGYSHFITHVIVNSISRCYVHRISTRSQMKP